MVKMLFSMRKNKVVDIYQNPVVKLSVLCNRVSNPFADFVRVAPIVPTSVLQVLVGMIVYGVILYPICLASS